MSNWKLSVCSAIAFFVILGAPSVRGQDWRPVGPPGGDVRSLAADPGDPRLLYLGVADGHIFGSRDGGEHWRLLGRVGTRLDGVVMAIVVDPRNPATLYAASQTLGSDGGGVFCSDDGGRNWRSIGLVGQSVRALAQAASNPNILIAGTLQAVFRSSDAGKSWEQISPANHGDLRNFDSIAIDPTNPEIIYAGTYHLAWKTTNGGRQWAPIHAGMADDSDVMSISIDQREPQRVFASACSGIYRSESGGALWVKIRGIAPSAHRTHLLLQDPLQSQSLYSATTEGLWKSLDGGITWTRVTPATWSIEALVIHPKAPGRLVIGVEGSGVYVSDDAGKNFHAANEGFYHRQVIDLAIDRERPERMLIVLTNSVDVAMATQDGGRNWTRLGSGLSAHAVRRVYAAPDSWWAALERGGLLRYDAQKNAWVKAGLIAGQEAPAAKPGKRSSKPLPARAASRPVIQVVNDLAFTRELWWAATEEGVLASRDRGVTWAQVPLGSAAKLPVHSVHVSDDGGSIWLVSPRGVVLSHDRGKTWTSQEFGFTPRGRLRLSQRDTNTLLMSSASGLYASTDAGQTWKSYNPPDLWVRDVAPAGDALLLSTQKRGLYISYDRGETWDRLEGPTGESYFSALAELGASPTILAASPTEGLYALEVPQGTEIARSAAKANNRGAGRTPQPVTPVRQNHD